MVGGRGVRLSPESIVREGDLFLAARSAGRAKARMLELQVRLASEVQLAWLEELVPELLASRPVHDLRFRSGPRCRARAGSGTRTSCSARTPVRLSIRLRLLPRWPWRLRPGAASIFQDDPAAAPGWRVTTFVKQAHTRTRLARLWRTGLCGAARRDLSGRTLREEVQQADKLPYPAEPPESRSAAGARPARPASLQVPQRP